MHPTDGFPREPGPFARLWATICLTMGWLGPCPKCGSRMERTPAPNEVYERSGAAMRVGGGRYGGSSFVKFSRVRITPVYDTCPRCGHRLRRGGIKTNLT